MGLSQHIDVNYWQDPNNELFVDQKSPLFECTSTKAKTILQNSRHSITGLANTVGIQKPDPENRTIP